MKVFVVMFVMVLGSACGSNKNNGRNDTDSLLSADSDQNNETVDSIVNENIAEADDETNDEAFDEDIDETIDENQDKEVDEEGSDIDTDVTDTENGKVICTGQTKCYNDTEEIVCQESGERYFGQDSQYIEKCIPKSYTVSGSSGNDIVTDNNTGLIWQRTLPEIYNGCTAGDPVGSMCTWQEAINYCSDLNYGGFDDWRLPERKALASITDYGKSDPSIDSDVFLDTPVSWFLSSLSFVVDSASVWSVYSGVGTVDTRKNTDATYVRCVRGFSIPESSFNEYAIEWKIVVKDMTTKLEWAKEDISGGTWEAVLNYCENLEYAGYKDWRLPNINELSTLFYDRAYEPASYFPGMYSDYFWSSSSAVSANHAAWRVNFFAGGVDLGGKEEKFYAICVR